MPAMLSFDEAVTLPVVWTTAHYCFEQAQPQSMHEVLVHAASGGVGFISAQWAMRVRATTHATASGVAKHLVLRSCDFVRLSSSRHYNACAYMLSSRLHGHRLHSLVNALSNDFISISFGLLACHGVFLEIGKNGIWSHSRSMAVQPFVDYIAVAVDDGCHSCPGWNGDPWWFNGELLQVSVRACVGEVEPLLLEGFAFEERAVQAAFVRLQRGANLGKIVVRVGGRESPLPETSMIQEERGLPTATGDSSTCPPSFRERGNDLGTLVCLSMDAERGVALLELHDPQRFNTMGWAIGVDMSRAINHLRQLDGVRAVSLQGAGRVFCAGGNPYESSGPMSLASSSQRILESTQVSRRAVLPHVLNCFSCC